jgi:hypothetical protein
MTKQQLRKIRWTFGVKMKRYEEESRRKGRSYEQ